MTERYKKIFKEASPEFEILKKNPVAVSAILMGPSYIKEALGDQGKDYVKAVLALEKHVKAGRPGVRGKTLGQYYFLFEWDGETSILFADIPDLNKYLDLDI